MYTVGAVVGQLPFAYLFTKLPMHWIIPFMDIAWGIFTLVQYRATSYAEIAAYRFLVGWFEVRVASSQYVTGEVLIQIGCLLSWNALYLR